jgi:AcrR family transcriptional regulator
MKRYQLKRRAERQADTRRRIIDAAIDQHMQGVRGATITAIAERAGVSRVTVYRHFPDELSLLVACTSTYNIANPLPDLTSWASVDDPERRLGFVLTDLYRYYAANERMLSGGADAIPTHPALAEALQPFFAAIGTVQVALSAGWPVDSSPGSLLAGALGHALDFSTWRSLRQQQGLTDDQAVTLMVAMVTSARDVALKRKQRSRKGRGPARPIRRAAQPATRPAAMNPAVDRPGPRPRSPDR